MLLAKFGGQVAENGPSRNRPEMPFLKASGGKNGALSMGLFLSHLTSKFYTQGLKMLRLASPARFMAQLQVENFF